MATCRQLRSTWWSVLVLVLLGFVKTTLGQQECVSKIDDLIALEEALDDYSQVRTYVMCPVTIYEIGTRDHNHDLVGFQVQPSIPLRPNLHLKCGESGERSNLCWIANGDVHIDGTNVMGVDNTASIENVVLEGFVFINSRRYSTWATKPGDITFKDCEWRDHTHAVAPVLLDFFDGTSRSLSVTFENCLFTGNRYFGIGSHTSVVYANSAQNAMTFRKTKFDNNNMLHNNTLAATNSFLIETLGPLTLEDTCFHDNAVGVSNVVVFGSSLSSSSVHTKNSTGNLCENAAVFQTLQQFDRFTPLCVNALAQSCLSDVTNAPTQSPTVSPTASPTGGPTISPTVAPAVPTTPSPTAKGATPAPVAPSFPLPPAVTPELPPAAAPNANPNAPIPPIPGIPTQGDFDFPAELTAGACRISYSIVALVFGVGLMWL